VEAGAGSLLLHNKKKNQHFPSEGNEREILISFFFFFIDGQRQMQMICARLISE